MDNLPTDEIRNYDATRTARELEPGKHGVFYLCANGSIDQYDMTKDEDGELIVRHPFMDLIIMTEDAYDTFNDCRQAVIAEQLATIRQATEDIDRLIYMREES